MARATTDFNTSGFRLFEFSGSDPASGTGIPGHNVGGLEASVRFSSPAPSNMHGVCPALLLMVESEARNSGFLARFSKSVANAAGSFNAAAGAYPARRR